MEKEGSKLNVYQRMLNVMRDVSYIAKGEKTVNGQYRFVSHDAVVAKIQPALVKHGIVAIPSVTELKQEGNRTMVALRTSFINVDNPEEVVCVFTHGFGIDNGDKGPGKAVSYAFKYALLKAFCLETGDDPDNDSNAVHEPVKCLEFDSAIPADYDDKTLGKLDKYLAHCSKLTGKHVEDIKREAHAKMDSFLAAFQNWSKKHKGDK